jgi:hypothetical protein
VKSCFNIAMVIVVVLATSPHLLCACGCLDLGVAGVAKQQDLRNCSHCHPTDSEPTPQYPQPCESCNCDLAPVVAPDPPVAARPLELGWHVDVAVDAESLQVASTFAPVDREQTGPPSLSSHPSAALPLLLEHLLF